MDGPAILILAAGRSARMGGVDKLMQDVEGEPLLLRQVRRALATGCPVHVALSAEYPVRAQVLDGLAVARVQVGAAREGMAASLREGFAAIGKRPVLLVLADMPEITTDDMAAVIGQGLRLPDAILRGLGDDGTHGHPVLFPVWALAEVARLTGDLGARDILARHGDRVHGVPLPARHALTDLDTPEDWARWRLP